MYRHQRNTFLEANPEQSPQNIIRSFELAAKEYLESGFGRQGCLGAKQLNDAAASGDSQAHGQVVPFGFVA